MWAWCRGRLVGRLGKHAEHSHGITVQQLQLLGSLLLQLCHKCCGMTLGACSPAARSPARTANSPGSHGLKCLASLHQCAPKRHTETHTQYAGCAGEAYGMNVAAIHYLQASPAFTGT